MIIFVFVFLGYRSLDSYYTTGNVSEQKCLLLCLLLCFWLYLYFLFCIADCARRHNCSRLYLYYVFVLVLCICICIQYLYFQSACWEARAWADMLTLVAATARQSYKKMGQKTI